MRLKAFKVKMYRPIIDSGWVDVDGVTVIVGKNESGKSALLKALHKFKSFSPEPYTLDREWPRGHRRERSTDAVVVQTRFDFEDGESDQIAELLPCGEKPTGVEISKTYKGEYTYKFLPSDLDYIEQVTKGSILSQLDELSVEDLASEDLQQAVSQTRNEVIIDLCISNGMVPHSCFDPDRIPLAMQSSISSSKTLALPLLQRTLKRTRIGLTPPFSQTKTTTVPTPMTS